MANIPEDCNVVVIGSGVVGAAVAYHLAKIGVNDVILLERKSFASGTSYHAAGMIRELQSSESMIWMSCQTNRLYSQIKEETGVDIHYKKVGSLYVSNNTDRLDEFKALHSQGKSFGLETHLLTPNEIKRYWPLVNCEDVLGGYFMPNDALVNPYQAALAMLQGARMRGVQTFERVKARKILRKQGKIYGVSTDQGDIACKSAVICGGIWSRDFSAESSVNVPLHACEHYYILTEEIEGVDSSLPALRDFEARCYARPTAGTYWHDDGKRLLCGFFEAVSKPWGMNGIPEDFEFGRLAEDREHLKEVLKNVKHRIPSVQNAKIEMFFNGPESFSYDNKYLVGETPEVENLYVCSGFCSRGIQAAGGAGMMIAEQIKNNKKTAHIDFGDVSILRASSFTGNKKYLHDRSTETLGLLFGMHYPFLQYQSARPVRTTPFHDRLQQAGACFGEQSGWERANFFTRTGETATYEYSFHKQNWHHASAREHNAARENIALFDQTSLAKFLVQGEDAERLLNRICGAQINVANGTIVYTQALNAQGGIEADWAVIRLDKEHFWVTSSVGSQLRDFTFLRRNIAPRMNVCVTDITSGFSVLGIMGPNSRKLLQRVSPADFSNQAFPFATSQMIDFGYAKARANRISYVGELGWEIFIPTEFALSCYDCLIEAARGLHMEHAGFHAMNSLRLEKGYRHWGHDISEVDTPLEAGLGFAVDFTKKELNGKERLLEQQSNGVRKKMAAFLIEEDCPLLQHLEPVFCRGKVVGRLTSGMHCHTMGGSIGLGYIHAEEPLTKKAILSEEYEIEILAKKYSAKVSLAPYYDPKNARMKV